ncbi:hypothetical protein PS467_09565 [Streptomyces luomodiensis]|uniref:Uncharacterized protein n=1 Tax=Streptomyces luomodiensis TaxID=3026192 RepID=A0ABY9USN0_9ACTN|nr:hypothetical protein [Streptomyces sp. SCA4-21]WNE95563.1 hypothetical protein PS467_09565 [Streptomyces sp. SCA4-21]
MSNHVDRAPAGRRWISLGLLFGGHSCHIPGPLSAFRPGQETPLNWDPAAQLDSALWEVRQAGFDPDEDYPGTTDRPWRLVCIGCGTPRRLSLTAIRGGRRCCGPVPTP